MSDPIAIPPEGANNRLARIEARLDLMEREHRSLADRMVRMETNQESTTHTLARMETAVQRIDAKLDTALTKEARMDGRRDAASAVVTWLPTAMSALTAVAMLIFTLRAVAR